MLPNRGTGCHLQVLGSNQHIYILQRSQRGNVWQSPHLMQLLFVSATNTVSPGPSQRPPGSDSFALRPTPSAKPATPAPATVLMVSFAGSKTCRVACKQQEMACQCLMCTAQPGQVSQDAGPKSLTRPLFLSRTCRIFIKKQVS